MKPYALSLPSLPSFWNSNDCLVSTAKETLREGGEEHFGGHRRVDGQEWSFHDCHRAIWALGFGLWALGFRLWAAAVLVYKPGCATGHTESEGREECLGLAGCSWRIPAPTLYVSPPPALAAVCTGLVPRQHVPVLLWLHPCLPCGEGTCSGEVAAVNTCDNAEYPIWSQGHPGLGWTQLCQLSPTVSSCKSSQSSTSWASGPLDRDGNARNKELVILSFFFFFSGWSKLFELLPESRFSFPLENKTYSQPLPLSLLTSVVPSLHAGQLGDAVVASAQHPVPHLWNTLNSRVHFKASFQHFKTSPCPGQREGASQHSEPLCAVCVTVLNRFALLGLVLVGKRVLKWEVIGESYYGNWVVSPVVLLLWALKHIIIDKQQWLKQAGRITMFFCQKYIMSCSQF